MSARWNASVYDELPLPHVAWGAWAIGELRLAGDEHLLDAGCGTGRDLATVLDAHPGVTATALDPSPTMIEKAHERLAPYGDRVRVLQGDVTQPIGVERPVDAVMSVAALHWVADHDAAFAQLHAALRPGGRLVFDCGGFGNIARTQAAIDAAGGDGGKDVHFATDVETRARLEAAGFDVQQCALVPDDVPLPDVQTLERYLATVIMGQHVAELGEDAGHELVARVATQLPDRVVDYVRLRAVATRGS